MSQFLYFNILRLSTCRNILFYHKWYQNDLTPSKERYKRTMTYFYTQEANKVIIAIVFYKLFGDKIHERKVTLLINAFDRRLTWVHSS